MRICTAPNRVSDAQVKACRFGICVFVQLWTVYSFVTWTTFVLVYVFLHGSEPKILYIVDLDNVLVYVFFARLRTRVDGELISLNVLVYACCTDPNQILWEIVQWFCFGICVFVQLRTPFIWCFRRERSFGICVFVRLRTPFAWTFAAIIVLVYACCTAPNPASWTFCFVQGFGICVFFTAPNQYSVSEYYKICFGICVFCTAPNLKFFDMEQVYSFSICVLFSSEPLSTQNISTGIDLGICIIAQFRTFIKKQYIFPGFGIYIVYVF